MKTKIILLKVVSITLCVLGLIAMTTDTNSNDTFENVKEVSAKLHYRYVSQVELNQEYGLYKLGEYNSPDVVFRAVGRYAGRHKLGAAIPSFEINKSGAMKVYFINGLQWMDIPEADLAKVYGRFIPGKVNSPIEWYRAVNRYTNDKFGGVQSFPTYEIGENGIRGAYLIRKFAYYDVTEKQLHDANPEFEIGKENSYEVWFRSANKWANQNGYYLGIPNFEIGQNRVRGVTCLGRIGCDTCSKVYTDDRYFYVSNECGKSITITISYWGGSPLPTVKKRRILAPRNGTYNTGLPSRTPVTGWTCH